MEIKVSLPGRDEVSLQFEDVGGTITRAELHAVGCLRLLRLVEEWRKKLKGARLQELPLPVENDHASLLMRELLLRARNEWAPPYESEELCHCRAVATSKVHASIIAGAHTPEQVTRETSASSQCGTCRSDVEKLIAYRLNKEN